MAYVSSAPEATNSAYGNFGTSFGGIATSLLSGGIVGAVDDYYNARMQADLMNYNAVEAQKNRDYQERLSNTAYQRAVSDLRKAGLNPYMVYGGASAANSPAGSVSSYHSAYQKANTADKIKDKLLSIVGNAFLAMSGAPPTMDKIGFG